MECRKESPDKVYLAVHCCEIEKKANNLRHTMLTFLPRIKSSYSFLVMNRKTAFDYLDFAHIKVADYLSFY